MRTTRRSGGGGARERTLGGEMARPHILVAGPIGAGKSTLTTHLADALGYPAFLEPAAERNPFLQAMYSELRRVHAGELDRARSAFHVQVFFLTDALGQHSEIAALDGGAVQDRSPYEHLGIFVSHLAADGHLTPDEVAVLHEMAHTTLRHLPKPDLLVRLHAPVSVLKERIRNRGRDYEQDMGDDYLTSHAGSYERWMGQFDACQVLHVDVSELDTRSDDGLSLVIGRIRRHIRLP